MLKQEFNDLLNEIINIEFSFRNPQSEVDANGKAIQHNPDLKESRDYDKVICFLIYLSYLNIINFDYLTTKEELSIAIANYIGCKKKLVMEIWESLKDDYPYFDKLIPLIASRNISRFKDDELESALAEWGKYRLGLNSFYPLLDERVCLNVIRNCQKQLGIDMEGGDILIQSDIQEILVAFMDENPKKARLFFNVSGVNLTSFKIALLLDCYYNISLITKIGDTRFDGVISLISNVRDCREWNYWTNHLKDGGFCIANGPKLNSVPQFFYEYNVPLILDIGNTCILYRKVKDEDKIVRYGQIRFDSYSESFHWMDKLSECVKNSITTSYYEELIKDDFKYTGEVSFDKVRRKADQRNFIWVKKSDVIIPVSEGVKWLWDTKLKDESILDYDSLSKDPFRISADSKYYLDPKVLQPNQKGHVLEECQINKKLGFGCDFEISDNYIGIFEDCYDPERPKDETTKEFDKALCCRVITCPALLYNGVGILRVNATSERPVCYRNYSFYYDSSFMNYTCSKEVEPIKINPSYDENFIIFQLLNLNDPHRSSHILVAPSKDEQHTYFLNKRLNHIEKLKIAVQELETEVQNSIAESKAYISGVGFRNFRKFTNLPTITLSGVNILVGGNNSGKSSFVKGLLLAFDNIKNYILDFTDHLTLRMYFRFDANNYHDVHIGTFDRSYSFSPMEDDGEDGRTMTFTICCAHFEIRLKVKPFPMDDSNNVPVSEVTIIDRKREAEFTFNYEHFYTSVKLVIDGMSIDISNLRFAYSVSYNDIGKCLFSNLIKGVIPQDTASDSDQDVAEKELIKGRAGFIQEIADELEHVVRNTQIEYIYAHGTCQKVLYNYSDKNDYMAQTLHDFMLEKTGDIEEEFIRKWLKEFGLGLDYDIHTIGGDAYILQIMNKQRRMIYLADLGMGSNQLVILILRMAIIIHRNRMLGVKPYRPTIIIEEPELNMHPNYQSKLADLFHEVHNEYSFNFIVETHSEYLVRRSQVIVAEKKYANEDQLKDKNPFKVYYFPSDGLPYEMIYRTDGNFSNDFGKGFFDEATKLLFEII